MASARLMKKLGSSLKTYHAVRTPPPPSSRFFYTGHLRQKFSSPRPLSRSFLLCIPLVGGAALYFAPSEPSPVPVILSCPTVIPCKAHTDTNSFLTHQMSSPREERKPWTVKKIIEFLREEIWEPILTGVRFLHLFILFAPVIVSAPMILVGRKRSKRYGERWGAVWWYGVLVAQMQRAGPTFIKLAQWAASRQDLFPAALCERMGALHSNGRPHSFKHTKRVIEDAFKRPFSEVFEEFDETPIGTGAIAQVYRATLKHDLIPPSYLDPKYKKKGLPKGIADAQRAIVDSASTHPPTVPTSSVAIKILHPRVAITIRRDLAIMRFFSTCLNLIPGIEWLSLSDEIEVFGTMMNEQLNLRHEATNLRTFEKNFAGRRAAVTFPRPLEDFSTTDVLVEEFQNAIPLKSFLRNGGGPYDDRLANLGLDAFLNMLLLDNFVHSDLHPGNIMVKFYKPTNKYVYKRILSSIFHTAPPEDGLSHSSPSKISPHNSDIPTPSEESDAIVARLRPRSHDPEAWIAELDSIAADGYLPSLVFLDTGLVTTLNAEDRRNFLDLFQAVAQFDGYRTGTLMVERCRTPELVVDPETFALKMQHLILGVKSKTFTLAKFRLSDLLSQVLINVRAHHVKMEGDFINTVLAILLLEGIGRQLDPNMDLFKSALPILRQLGSQMTAREAMDELPKGNLGAMFKIWVWIEAREFASSAIVNVNDMVKYDWLSPNI